MQFESKGTLLTAESKPYSFQGNEGVSHKIRVNVGGEIYSCNSNADQVASMKQYEGVEGDVVLKVSSRKEVLGMTLVSFS